MNDGSPRTAIDDPPLPSSSSSSSSPTSDRSQRDRADFERNGGGDGDDVAAASQSARSPVDDTPESRLASKCHLKLLELLNVFDSLVYMELAALYYLDTSTILIILRTLVHLTQISHARTLALARANRLNLKPARTNIFLVLSINLIALFIHAFVAPAEASEATRGYLHGHLIVDLIGQKAAEGFLGRVRLCIMDCVVGVLQVIAVGIVGEADKAEAALERSKYGGRPAGDGQGSIDAIPGERRNSNTVESGFSVFGFGARHRANTNDNERQRSGIELQELAPASASAVLGRAGEADFQRGLDLEQQSVRSVSSDRLHSDSGLDRTDSPSHMLECFSSGEVILIRLRILDLLRDHFWEWRNRRLTGRV